MLTRLDITQRAVVLDGKPFGATGSYEKIVGTMHFAVDPNHALHTRVVDLDRAPRNAKGLVEFAADFYLLKPVDMDKGNGRLLVDCANRGRKVALGMLNSAPRVPDPSTPQEFGNGFLMRHGYTVAWIGWQVDVPRRDGLMALDAPRALGVVGQIRCEMRPNKRVTTLPLADRYHIPNPTIDLNDAQARMFVKEHSGAPAVEVPRSAWRFSDPLHVEIPEGFTPGHIYDVVYRSADPLIVGCGFLSTRDGAAFLRSGHPDNPCRGKIRKTYLFGVSQTGRFLRTMLNLGLDQDEQGSPVFDGIVPHIAGGRRGEFNVRLGQPSLNAKGAVGELPPFNDHELFAGIAARAQPPRIMLTNSAAEYWRGDASLIHTDREGTRDVEPAEHVRIYLLAGTQHTPGALPPLEADANTGDRGLQRFNIVDYAPLMRAVFVNLDRWVTDGIAPPPNAFPRIADGTAVPAESTGEFFRTIPGVRFPDRITRPLHLDFGPDMARGIPAYPAKTAEPYPSYVSTLDTDGNEFAGIRPPELLSPLATYCGWNVRHPDQGVPGDLMQMMSSTLPFPRTRVEREMRGDPRASIEERYASREVYLAHVRRQTLKLIEQQRVLDEDLDAIVARAGAAWDYIHA
jgi:hypothetical protein